MLHRVFGVSDLAVATVLACFFLGLGVGSALASRIAGRLARPAVAYAALEVAVAAYALASVPLMPRLHDAYAGLGGSLSFEMISLVRFSLASAALLPPTIAMGATLPVLARLMPQQAWSGSVTALYTANTLGAVSGAALGGFWLIPQLGTRASVIAAAVLGIAAAAIAMLWMRRDVPRSESDAGASAKVNTGRSAKLGIELVLTTLSGAIALGSEVVWTRVLRIIVHGTTGAFAAMLVNYLLGIAIGALLARRIVARVRAGVAFGVLQSLAILVTALAVITVPQLPRVIPLARGELDIVPHETWVLLLASASILFPLAIVTGTGLPLTWAMAAERTTDSAGASGRLLAANTIGGLVGALATGFFLVPTIGVEATLFTIATFSALASAIALRSSVDGSVLARVGAMTGPFVLLALVLAARPTLSLPYLLGAAQQPLQAMIAGPSESWRDELVFLREGRNTTVTVRRTRTGLALYNDGRPESGFSAGDPGFGHELVLLGALPGLFAEQRERVLIVGIGAGHTTTMALACGFEHVEAVELEQAVVDAARLLHDARGRPFPVDDPRVTLHIDDARNRIALAPSGSLDAVISQPSHPWLAGSSALYTTEFFEEVARALHPGGAFALWLNVFRMDAANLRSVLGTLSDVFPNVHGFVVEGSSLVLVATRSDLDWDRSAARMQEPALAALLRAADLSSVPRLGAKLELDAASARALGRDAERIRDDRPLLEFRLAQLSNTRRFELRDLDVARAHAPWLAPGASLAASSDVARVTSERIGTATSRPRALRAIAASLESLALSSGDRAMLEGRLADARGDVGGAIAAYERAGTPDAEALLDRLRLAEGMHEALLDRAISRAVQPTEGRAMLESALAMRDLATLRVTLAIADGIGYPPERELRDAVRAYVDRGCDGILEASAVTRLAATTPELARTVAECAQRAGASARAEAFAEEAVRARWRQASNWTDLGQRALAGGNGGLAWVALNRALTLQPTNSAAAIALARLHARDGRPQLAQQVILEAWRRNDGFEDARATLAAAASDLRIDLGIAPRGSSTSASTAPDAPDVTPSPR
ncbi:Hypothetical protein DB32_004025 [Sandaracinus amylolyticus]|uniref:Major facilitator superfamily (MFS) profile domain-containing protein n=2 Tax=Sandaracinus amylolyticus TaxID=927083 RepID=A0A0F6YIC9_9BACT|nr:Hypothetical protein DB32_004025 [Sandaracinus amylolyticus]